MVGGLFGGLMVVYILVVGWFLGWVLYLFGLCKVGLGVRFWAWCTIWWLEWGWTLVVAVVGVVVVVY